MIQILDNQGFLKLMSFGKVIILIDKSSEQYSFKNHSIRIIKAENAENTKTKFCNKQV